MIRNSKNSLNPLAQAVNAIDEQELQFFLERFQAHIDEHGTGIDSLLSITLGHEMGTVYEYLLNEMVLDVFSGNVFDYFNVPPLSLTAAARPADHPLALQQVASITCDEDTAAATVQYTQSLHMRAGGYERPYHASETDATDVPHMMPAPPQLPLPPLPPQLALPALPPQLPLPDLPADATLAFDVPAGAQVIDEEQALCESYPDIYLHGNFTLVGLHAAWQHAAPGAVDAPPPFNDAYAIEETFLDTFMNEVVCVGLEAPSAQAPEVDISYYLMSVAYDTLSF